MLAPAPTLYGAAVTEPSPRARRAERDGARGWLSAAAPILAAAAVVLSLYLAHPIASGYRYPIGPDGPVYTWLARYAGAAGFAEAPGGGPGVPGLILTLGRLLRTEPLPVITVLGPVLAAICGLAGAALVVATGGGDASRSAAAVILTGTFAAYLAGGWLANLAMVAAFLAALAALALVGRSWHAVAGGGGLLAAAGLSHRAFFLVGLVIVAGVILTNLSEARAQVRTGRRGRDTLPVRMLIAAVGGAGAAILGFASLGGPSIPGDTSQDGFFRRLGLRGLLLERYRQRFLGDLGRAAVPVAAGLGLGLTAAPARPLGRDTGARFLWSALATWAAITVVGIATLAVTGWGPPNRLLQFSFFLPIGAAIGVGALLRRGGVRAAAGLVAGAAFAAVSMVGWVRQSPAFGADDLSAVATAGRVVARLPAGVPLVFVVDTDQPAAAYHVTRAGNLIRIGIPPVRIPDVRLAVGDVEDVVARRPTFTGDPEHDALAAAYLEEARPVLDRAAVLVLRPLDQIGYAHARAVGTQVAPGVAVVRGAPTTPIAPAPAPEGLGPVGLLALSAGVLVALGVLGTGWARWSLPGIGRRGHVAAAPSAGIGVVVLGSFAADRVGLVPGGLGSAAAVLALAAAGYVVAGRWPGRDPAGRRASVGPDEESRNLLRKQGM